MFPVGLHSAEHHKSQRYPHGSRKSSLVLKMFCRTSTPTADTLAYRPLSLHVLLYGALVSLWMGDLTKQTAGLP